MLQINELDQDDEDDGEENNEDDDLVENKNDCDDGEKHNDEKDNCDDVCIFWTITLSIVSVNPVYNILPRC